MSAKCGLCKVANADPADSKWALRHRDDVVSLKPFGAANKGHRIFIPVVHLVDASDDPALTARCFEEAAIWGRDHKKAFNLIVNSGRDAGQGTFHLHVHYVPRVQDDGFGYRWKAE